MNIPKSTELCLQVNINGVPVQWYPDAAVLQTNTQKVLILDLSTCCLLQGVIL
jgi:hypothetical protein